MVIGKKGDTSFVVLVIVLVITGIIAIIIKTTIHGQEDNSGEWSAIGEVGKNNETPFSTLLDKNNAQNSSGQLIVVSTTESSGSGGGGGGGSSEGGVLEEVVIPTCTETRPASYSILTLNQSQTCNEYDGEICVSKEVVCSALLRSDDSLISKYEINLVFAENKKSKDTDGFGTLSSSYTLNPHQSIVIQGQTTVVSTTEDGIANQIINCFFSSVGEPVACLN